MYSLNISTPCLNAEGILSVLLEQSYPPVFLCLIHLIIGKTNYMQQQRCKCDHVGLDTIVLSNTQL